MRTRYNYNSLKKYVILSAAKNLVLSTQRFSTAFRMTIHTESSLCGTAVRSFALLILRSFY